MVFEIFGELLGPWPGHGQAMDATKRFKFIGFGGMDATKPYIRFLVLPVLPGRLPEPRLADYGPVSGRLGTEAGFGLFLLPAFGRAAGTRDTGRFWGGAGGVRGILVNPASGPREGFRSRCSAELSRRLSFRIVVETRRNRPRVVRNRCVPVCAHRSKYVELGLAQL